VLVLVDGTFYHSSTGLALAAITTIAGFHARVIENSKLKRKERAPSNLLKVMSLTSLVLTAQMLPRESEKKNLRKEKIKRKS